MVEITCKGCGRAMDSELKFCPGCGRRVEAAPPPPPLPLLPLVDDEVAGTAGPEIEKQAAAAPPVEKLAVEVEPPESESEGAAASPGDEAEAEAEAQDATEQEEVEPRGDTVQMSLSDATKVWIEESGTQESVPTPAETEKSRLPLFVGLLVLAAAALALILFVL